MGALRRESGWHDLSQQERSSNWYGVEYKGARALVQRMVERVPQEFFPSNLDKLREEVSEARKNYAVARDARKITFRDAALKVLGDVAR